MLAMFVIRPITVFQVQYSSCASHILTTANTIYLLFCWPHHVAGVVASSAHAYCDNKGGNCCLERRGFHNTFANCWDSLHHTARSYCGLWQSCNRFKLQIKIVSMIFRTLFDDKGPFLWQTHALVCWIMKLGVACVRLPNWIKEDEYIALFYLHQKFSISFVFFTELFEP